MAITILDPLVANQIAAGEVIERPAAIVKELMENSIDAGSSRIDITVEKGGIERIQVQDNGEGIAKDELSLAIQRHGTSKIHQLNDLQAIHSLGFRGEALASICAVAKVKLSSRTKNTDQAWQIIAQGTNQEAQQWPVAQPQGTIIEVRDLFFNTPARKKFLRAEKTEFSHIDEVIKKLALAHFYIRITLYHGDKRVRQFLPAQTRTQQEKRIQAICSKEFMHHAIRVERQATGLQLSGWIASANFASSPSNVQYMYVNGRQVRDRLFHHAIRQSYGEQLNSKQYPGYVLFLECEPHMVDVNVHPTKHEVRFQQGRLIHDFIVASLSQVVGDRQHAIEEALTPTFQLNEPQATYLSQEEQHRQWPTSQQQRSEINHRHLVGCLHHRYIIIETEQGLLLIDGKRLHQWIFAQALSSHQDSATMPLLFPITFTLNPAQYQQLEYHQATLMELGFDIQSLGTRQAVLRTAPSQLSDLKLAPLLKQLLSDLNVKHTLMDIMKQCAEIAAQQIVEQQALNATDQLLNYYDSLTKAEQRSMTLNWTLNELAQWFQHD